VSLSITFPARLLDNLLLSKNNPKNFAGLVNANNFIAEKGY
jgi:hypothetical protein